MYKNYELFLDVEVKNEILQLKGGIVYMLAISEMKYLNAGECADIHEIDDHTVLKLGKVGWEKENRYGYPCTDS